MREIREFEIVPHYGVGPIQLGMARDDVRAILGEPDAHRGDEREDFLQGFCVDFDSAGRVEFIELARSPLFRGLFHGVCLHELPAEEAVAFVSRYDDYDKSDRERGYSYLFLDLQLSLWRGTCVDSGAPSEQGRCFEAVGIARKGYLIAGR